MAAASSLQEEIVQEILVRLPLNEPEHLARASLVCKAWRRVVLSGNRGSFWRHCREVHGAPPPLLGYIQNHHDNSSSPMQFVPVPSTIAAPVISMPAAVDCSGWCAIDSRHGRVLILDANAGDPSAKRLIVWDPITGDQQHISMPSYYSRSNPCYYYAGAVLCAKDGDGCDHCHCHGGPFHVVLVEANRRGSPQFAIAAKYSSLTGAWGAPTTDDINHRFNYLVIGGKQSLLVGGALYFPYEYGQSIVIKYDLDAHRLSDIELPQHLHGAILMKAEHDGGLGLATLNDNCICLWSSRDVPNNVIVWWCGERRRWVQDRVIKLGTSLPRHAPFQSYKVIGFAEGTNTIFINISAGIFTLDLKSNKVRKVGEREADRVDPILPYMSYYVPRPCDAGHLGNGHDHLGESLIRSSSSRPSTTRPSKLRNLAPSLSLFTGLTGMESWKQKSSWSWIKYCVRPLDGIDAARSVWKWDSAVRRRPWQPRSWH